MKKTNILQTTTVNKTERSDGMQQKNYCQHNGEYDILLPAVLIAEIEKKQRSKLATDPEESYSVGNLLTRSRARMGL